MAATLVCCAECINYKVQSAKNYQLKAQDAGLQVQGYSKAQAPRVARTESERQFGGDRGVALHEFIARVQAAIHVAAHLQTRSSKSKK